MFSSFFTTPTTITITITITKADGHQKVTKVNKNGIE